MLFDNRPQALRRALVGGLVGVAAHLLLGYLLGSIPLEHNAYKIDMTRVMVERSLEF